MPNLANSIQTQNLKPDWVQKIHIKTVPTAMLSEIPLFALLVFKIYTTFSVLSFFVFSVCKVKKKVVMGPNKTVALLQNKNKALAWICDLWGWGLHVILWWVELGAAEDQEEEEGYSMSMSCPAWLAIPALAPPTSLPHFAYIKVDKLLGPQKEERGWGRDEGHALVGKSC